MTLDDIDLFVYHQANGRILKAVAEKLELPRRARRRLRRRDRQHVGRLDPAHAQPAARGRPPAAGPAACCSPPSAPASPGARASSSGACADGAGPTTPSRSSPAPPRASAPRSPRRSPPTAGTSPSTTAPTRTAPRRPSRRSRRPAAPPPRLHGDVANGAPDELFTAGRGGARRPGARARQQRRRARRQPRAPDRGRGLGHGPQHEPVRRLPPHQALAAADAQGALRPDRQHRLRRRPARQRRPGELRGRQGRA